MKDGGQPSEIGGSIKAAGIMKFMVMAEPSQTPFL
jgi:hypothetical protein